MWLRKVVSRVIPPMPSIAPLTQTVLDEEYRRQRNEVDVQVEALIELAHARLGRVDDQHQH